MDIVIDLIFCDFWQTSVFGKLNAAYEKGREVICIKGKD